MKTRRLHSFASRTLLLAGALVLLPVCAHAGPPAPTPNIPTRPAKASAAPTAADAAAFMADVDKTLMLLRVRAETAEYIKATYITPDTERNAAQAQADVMAYLSTSIPKAATFRDLQLEPELRRKLDTLRTNTTLPAPADAALRDELAGLSARLEGHYGEAKGCRKDAKGVETCRDLGQLSDALEAGKTWDDITHAWLDWHGTAAESRANYARLVELGNKGAAELGFADMGVLWRSGYDMSATDFEAEIERLWQQVRPLYEKLHCAVRAKLSAKWGEAKVPKTGPIPAQVFGNMWSQDWGALNALMAPYPKATTLDITAALTKKKVDAPAIVKMGESFFTSLGLAPLPATFWERSQFVKPRDREVVCHASAWDVTFAGDVRIKMCIKVNEDNFVTVHHELGHIFYYLAYKTLPILFQSGANDGFHEAIGDAIALSITPKYLVDIGLFEKAPGDDKAVLNDQMRRALDKVAFLPFGRLIDQWRWDVFSGKTPQTGWNSAWWDLKLRYQGVVPPAVRSEADFDPGAKYHVASNVPYMRYFLASILQFQFHRALCKAAGHTGPLHACSIYGNKEAGARLQALLAAGASKPWQEALFALTGETKMDATAMLDYFAPLSAWLDEQNKGQTCGW